jgi:hypothetical protein
MFVPLWWRGLIVVTSVPEGAGRSIGEIAYSEARIRSRWRTA